MIRVGRFWAVEVPILEVYTQGHTRKEAYEMVADAIECLTNKEGFKVEVFPGKNGYFELTANDIAALISLMLRRLRANSGLTLAEVSKRLGSTSPNAYARYEQGRCVPTLVRLGQLLAAVTDGRGFVISETAI